MLSAEKHFFLTCLSDHLHGRKTSAMNDVDYGIIAQYAKEQQLSGIVFYQCKNLTGFSGLQSSYSFDVYSSVKREKAKETIVDLLVANNIPFAFLKGAELSSIYPVQALRTMGDIDVLVHQEDKKKAGVLLENKGFLLNHQDENEWVYGYDGILIELHHNFCHDRSTIATKEIREYSDNIWQYMSGHGLQSHLDWSHHVVLIVIHIRQHLLAGGVGFRQFLDMAMAVEKCRVDWELVRKTLSEIGLSDFGEKCIGLCNRWFDLEISVSAPVSDQFFEEATDAIFSNGVLQDSQENTNNMALYQMNSQTGRSYILRILFPSYKEMCARNYTFLQNRPFLLPLAWIVRLFRSIKIGSAKKMSVLLPFVKKEETRQQYSLLIEWGVIKKT